MNKADSERLESAFTQMGLTAAPSPKNADVIVLNSCVVHFPVPNSLPISKSQTLQARFSGSAALSS